MARRDSRPRRREGRARPGLLAGVLCLLLAAPPRADAKSRAPTAACADDSVTETTSATATATTTMRDRAQIWLAPQEPVVGQPLRVLVVSENPLDLGESASLTLVDGAGHRSTLAPVRRGGPPWSFEASASVPIAGTYRVEWSRTRNGGAASCRTVAVVARRPQNPVAAARKPGLASAGGSVGAWATTRTWDRATEDLFSAWVESLFDAPPGESLGFRPLAQAIRDRGRNFLYDYRGLGEDDPTAKSAFIAEPDCADLPYFLRAYFSWKLGLPFGMRDCDRGTDTRPPRCAEWITNESPPAGRPPPPPRGRADALAAMKKFLRLLANKVHSGSARTALTDDSTDYYPVQLTRTALRPGTIFADPYGHVLTLVRWVDQTPDAGGILLAVDGQPDNSVGRKRFWEGTFLYANDIVGAGPGFKAFRPLVRGADGKLTTLANAALHADPRFAPFSTEQMNLDRESFYARMGKLINPRGLAPEGAYRDTLDALAEQLATRVGSIDNGEKYLRENHTPVVAMPEGAKIFETVGPWEDYATPSRDLRLQIAMHVLEALPGRIVAHPELYNLGGRAPAAARAAIEKLHAASVAARTLAYTRSDGGVQTLTVADVLARKLGLEMAYNPNDCVEVRWAAPEGSAEAASCKRHAPEEQRARMEQVRSWFHDMKRPAR